MPISGGALEQRAQELAGRREAFVRATVVRAQRPTSVHAGDTALLHADGHLDGFVGGACVEASVREYGLQALSAREPLLLRVVAGEPSHSREDGAVEVSNPCLSGGAVEIFLEPSVPAPRVVVVGATPVAQALAVLGAGLGFEMELVDGAATETHPDDAALIVASHGHDEEASLEAALRAGVPYVALVASAKRGPAVVASLNVEDRLRSRVFSPAGLDLGARTPAEVALSILAQLVVERAGQRSPEAAAAVAVAAPTTAIDPVCGMSVAAVDATPHVERDGVTTYFCSTGCRAAFLAGPERYASPA
ncbi:xanthine dehydrogenase accessory factor [Cryobacterium sp. MP_M5]|uniref:XdhC family protein n=1 Tax=unclassified Cryobacterium TaxID=2649013 RepID=UPI0018CA08C9|nr:MULTISPECIES: XdhC family protein [unclassified Cryobacterium]MBG6059352.1 xanthine dehydrogenase accessory factor [Cryobacterium sp. MP_M3]MEC5177800.1 xanthine dehydrogenase accessory factor [Cryobacterium sp. MP_M5]